jgi:ESF2/ABP1 family protein
MATKERNRWLEADDSEAEGFGSNSDGESDGGRLTGLAAHRTKRRRNSESDDESISDSESTKGEVDSQAPVAKRRREDESIDNTEENSDHGDVDNDDAEATLGGGAELLKPLSMAELQASKAATKKTGVIYISRVPVSVIKR